MPIDFACTGCGATIKAPEGSGGRHAHCPACGTSLTIPSRSDPAVESTKEHSPKTSAPTKPLPSEAPAKQPAPTPFHASDPPPQFPDGPVDPMPIPSAIGADVDTF